MPRPNRPVYLDNHATTPPDPRVLAAMRPWWEENFANPHSAEHAMGREAEEAVEAAIAAVEGDRAGLVSEAADVLYHLLVVLKAGGVGLDEVMAELARRTAQSGLAEKAARRHT